MKQPPKDTAAETRHSDPHEIPKCGQGCTLLPQPSLQCSQKKPEKSLLINRIY